MEGLFLSPGITTEGRLYVQAEYGRWLFFSSTATFIKQLCSAFLVRESLRAAFLMVRLGTSSKNLNKIAENTNVCNEKDKYLNSDIFMICL